LEQSAILDSVAGQERTRAAWRNVAQRYAAAFRVIECICSDVRLQQVRLEGRDRGISGWYELSWEDIERARMHYQPWLDQRLVLDAAQPLEQNLDALRLYLP